jgi:hypothetical protein
MASEDRGDSKIVRRKKRLWGAAICAVLLTLGVAPATAAKVWRFTDNQGVIHITNEGEAHQDLKVPETSGTPAYHPASHDVPEISPEPPGNFADRVPRDKRYKLKVFYNNKITLPN